MNARHDDDALSWDGDDDPTLDVAPDAARTPVAKKRTAAAPAAGRKPASRVVDPEGESAALGNVALVSLGLIVGAYIFFAIGWFIAGLRLQDLGGLPVSPAMLGAATVAASAAPPIWFVSAFVLTRRSRTGVRFAWLIAGAVLLVPWPFLFTGVI